MSDNIRREVRKMKRDATTTSGDAGDCPFCSQPFRSPAHKAKSYAQEQERYAGARDALLEKLDEIARNRNESDRRLQEQEQERAEGREALREVMPARELGAQLRERGKLT